MYSMYYISIRYIYIYIYMCVCIYLNINMLQTLFLNFGVRIRRNPNTFIQNPDDEPKS